VPFFERGSSVRGPRLVAATTLAVALGVLIVGWTTGLRAVLHGALLSLALFALLPFAIIAAGVTATLLAALALAITAAFHGAAPDSDVSAMGETAVRAGGGLIPRYYRFLARRRHPLFWGIPAGLLLGALCLAGVLAGYVLPKEARTVGILAAAKQRIDDAYARTGIYPPADAEGHLEAESGVVVDGFGRPLAYQIAGPWKFAAYTLTSLGFDGKPGADDLCVAGSTRLRAWADTAKDLARILGRIGAGTATTEDRLAGVRAAACPTGSQGRP
jgi:hypothetical protein